MQYLKNLFIPIASCILLLPSCEKVIDVDLNSASPKYVIEGEISDGQGPHQVRITQTKNFDEDNTFEGVSDAEITIADNAGNSEVLIYTGNGFYETRELVGVPGRTYYLAVNADGETFTAESTMPYLVSFDSLYLKEVSTFGDSIRTPTVTYSDTAGIRNYYKHNLYVNNARVPFIYIGTDEGIDGSQKERGLSFSVENGKDELKAGDSISVEVQSIAKEVYGYFFSLDLTISQSVATPANPVSNIQGGALGYFSAHSSETRTLVLD